MLYLIWTSVTFVHVHNIKLYFRYVIKRICVSNNIVFMLQKIPEGAIILLHACAHNPTGVDPKPADWEKLSQVPK